MDFKKAKRNKRIMALVFTVMLPLGIFMIIMGAVNAVWSVMIIGICLTVIGFYGTPLSWVSYATFASNKSVYEMITVDGITSVKAITAALGSRRFFIVRRINYLIAKRYLVGYIFDGDDTISRLEKPKPTPMFGKCPNCGAVLTDSGDKYYCAYCQASFPKSK